MDLLVCFLTHPGTTCQGMAAPLRVRTVLHQSSIRICPTAQTVGGIYSIVDVSNCCQVDKKQSERASSDPTVLLCIK